MPIDRAILFASIRKSIFGGRMSAPQVSGTERILTAFDLYGTRDRRHLAYILATDVRETGRRMQPVREAFGTSTADTIARLDKAWAAGKLGSVKTPYWRAGWFGRGDVQLTHEDNYRRMGTLLGVDLVGNPDLALDPTISARIIVEGMLRGVSGRGDFSGSGKALEDYISGSRCDYIGARYTVNGQDAAAEIAANAKLIERALIDAGATTILMPVPVPPSVPAVCPNCGQKLAA